MSSLAVTLNKTEKKDFYKTFIAIVIPIAIQNVLNSSLGLIDTFMISSLGTAEIAGVTAGYRVLFFYFLFLFGISSGAAVLTAQYFGSKDIKNIRRVLGMTILVAFAGALILMVPIMISPAGVIAVITKDREAVAKGADYLGIVFIGFIPIAISIVYSDILRTVGRIKAAVIISVIALAVNTLLNYILIFGKLGVAPMGVKGAGVASVVSMFVEMMLVIIVAYKKDSPLAAKMKELFDVNKEFAKKYFKTVLPVLGNEMIWVVGVTIYDIVYGHMGARELATMGIVRTIEGFAFFMLWSLGSGAAIVLGNKLGEGVGEKVYEYVKLLFRILVIFSVSIAVIIFLTRDIVSGLFLVEENLEVMIAKALMVLALLAPLKATNYLIIVAILRSGGDTFYALLLDAGGVWLIGVPLVFVTGILLKLDVTIVYLMTAVEEFIKIFFGIPRVISKKWIRNLTIEE